MTPDSFSDGGLNHETQSAIARGHQLIAEGADLIDVGGESTRPGALGVDVVEELRRVIPVIRELACAGLPVSVDTQKPEVMRAAVAAGAIMVNDVNGFEAPGAVQVIQESQCGVCIMHKQGAPESMQQSPRYRDVVIEVSEYLQQRVRVMVEAGVNVRRLVIDPGFGFGKSTSHNLEMLRMLSAFQSTGVPILVGLSRKSMIGAITGRAVADRIHGSVAAALLAVERGANIVRVHDVAATRDALAMWHALQFNAN